MEQTIKVDRQGRLVLPSRIRETLGLKEGGSIFIRVDGSRVVLEPAFEHLSDRVTEWKQTALGMKSEAFTDETDESWKWMSHEYAKRKLGL
jgi:AbrB family looped-hinge helix DNA binding protein